MLLEHCKSDFFFREEDDMFIKLRKTRSDIVDTPTILY